MVLIARACALLALLMLAACAASEPSRFYTLSPQARAEVGGAPAATGRAGRHVALSPVQVPRYLDRPQIIIRTDANTIELAEFDKWSEPLAEMVGRVLSEDLSHHLPGERVFLLPVRQAVPIDRLVDMQIMRFDADAGGVVTLDARFQVFGKDGRSLIAARNTLVREPAGDDADKAALVAAMSRALSGLAADIAEVLRDEPAGRRAGPGRPRAECRPRRGPPIVLRFQVDARVVPFARRSRGGPR
jgi:uncharacterized lipoprotein YmbA